MNFDFFSKKKDTSHLIIKDHDLYYTPLKSTCQNLLQRNGIKDITPEFIQELSRFFVYQMLGEENYINQEFLDKNGEKFAEEIARKVPFYKELYDQYVPGWSPVEKAIFLVQYIQNMQNKNLENELSSQSTKDQADGKKDGEQEAESGGSKQEKTKGKPNNVEFILNDIKDNLPGQGEWENPYMNELFDNKANLADFKTRIEFLEKLAMIDTFGNSFEIRKKITQHRVPNSSKFAQKKMSQFEDILTSPLYQMAFPDYNIRLARKTLISNIPVKPETQKQKIIMLIDDSGSMSERFKVDWVNAIVADRLQYAMKEECDIFFSYFLTGSEVSRYKWTHIYNHETAMKFWKEYSFRPCGGKRIASV